MTWHRPLRKVMSQRDKPGWGRYDVLECEHQEPYTGVEHEERRCNQCPLEDDEVKGQEALPWDQ